jgi:predicted tellurium resistance membrane protein TerC
MEFNWAFEPTTAAFWVALGKIIWINALLSGDNAVVIALACRGLPPQQRKIGMFLGALRSSSLTCLAFRSSP